ncbi:MAG: VOC family protein [Sphingomonas adhaesiva]|uniref:VOC family protein n=1 Tax=Sphingomonas adhaesiva TaxID=28212 RepID=UPI002FF5622C
MTNPHGTPVWYQLVSPDPDAAEAFYGHVLGWTTAPDDPPPPPGENQFDYREWVAPDGERIGGLMAPPPFAGMAPGWCFYAAVDDVDATIAAAVAAGAQAPMPAVDLPGTGRIALLIDPDGHRFYVMNGPAADRSQAFQPGDAPAPGHAVWNELTAADQDRAVAFYAGLLGWHQAGAMPMGALGDYKFVHAGPTAIGAAMNTPPGGAPGWCIYFAVDDIDAAAARVGAGGGAVVQGPDAIPGGRYSVVARDPHGASFGVVGPRRG